MIINITYDTVTKKAVLSKDGTETPFDYISISKAYDDKECCHLSIESNQEDKSNGTMTRTVTYASEAFDVKREIAKRVFGENL